jgi:hypothetical protein
MPRVLFSKRARPQMIQNAGVRKERVPFKDPKDMKQPPKVRQVLYYRIKNHKDFDKLDKNRQCEILFAACCGSKDIIAENKKLLVAYWEHFYNGGPLPEKATA